MDEKIFVISHGDFDGIASAALLIQDICREKGMNLSEIIDRISIKFVQPFHLNSVKIPEGTEAIYVVDIGINSQYPSQTRDFIEKISNKLVKWYDHHQGWSSILSEMSQGVRDKFVIDENAKACALILNSPSELAKDAVVADTREGELSEIGTLIDQALKSNLGDEWMKIFSFRYLLGETTLRLSGVLEKAAKNYQAVQLPNTKMLLEQCFRLENDIAVVDIRKVTVPYDTTLLSVLARNLSPKKTAVLLTLNERGIVLKVFTSRKNIDLTKILGLKGGNRNAIQIPVAPWHVEGVILRLKEKIH